MTLGTLLEFVVEPAARLRSSEGIMDLVDSGAAELVHDVVGHIHGPIRLAVREALP